MKTIRQCLLWLHRWAGVFSGLIILVAAVTGALLVFERPLHRWMEPLLYPAKPGDNGRKVVEPALALLHEKHPEVGVQGIALPRGDRDALRLFAGNRVFYFDPTSGALFGARPRQGSFAQTVTKLHTSLLLGSRGNTAVVIATVLTTALALSGLWLWWPLRIGWFRRGANFRRFNLDLHSVAGLYSSLFLLVIATTGVTLRYLHVEHPPIPMAPMPHPGSEPMRLDACIERAEAALPGARAVALELPGPNPRAPLRIQLAFPEDGSPAGRSVVFIDRYEGNVIQVHNARAGTLLERYGNLQLSLHTGAVAGLPSQCIAFATCLAVVLQVISGYVLWWIRPERKPANAS